MIIFINLPSLQNKQAKFDSKSHLLTTMSRIRICNGVSDSASDPQPCIS